MSRPVLLRHSGEEPALIDAATGDVISYARLHTLVATYARQLKVAGKRLVFLFADNSVRTAVAYLAALESGHAIALLDSGLAPALGARLIDEYRPEIVVHPPGREPLLPSAYRRVGADLVLCPWPAPAPIHSDLSVLLTTSGSTGSPKLVRLSRDNIVANAESIASSLDLTPAERAVTSLPLHYSYGMSVLNSHLLIGASILVTETDLLSADFWSRMVEHRVTSLAGVPFTYQTMRRIGFETMDLPCLTTLTQAGGRLDPTMAAAFANLMRGRNGKFFVMYGQTEAAPRIACMPLHQRTDKVGSAGVAIPGVEIFVRDEEGGATPPGLSGAIFCRGANVMMGYAEDRADLALGDVHGDILETGDVGYLDEDGFLFLTGRAKRIAKLSGVRISLDEVEAMISAHGPVAVVADTSERLRVFCAWGDDTAFANLRRQICRDLRVPAPHITFKKVGQLPVLPNGKTDYRALTEGILA